MNGFVARDLDIDGVGLANGQMGGQVVQEGYGGGAGRRGRRNTKERIIATSRIQIAANLFIVSLLV